MDRKFTKRIGFRLFGGILVLGLILILVISFIEHEPNEIQRNPLGLPSLEEIVNKEAEIGIATINSSNAQADLEAPLMSGVRAINKICPRMVDKGTRIDNAQLLSESTIQINYTMLNWTKDALDIERSKKLNLSNAISTVKKSSMIKFYREHKVTVVYHYSDKNGVFLFETVVTPDMYLNSN
jgi:hypothetical protein